MNLDKHFQRTPKRRTPEQELVAHGVEPVVALGRLPGNGFAMCSILGSMEATRRALILTLFALDTPIATTDEEVEKVSDLILQIIADRIDEDNRPKCERSA